MDRGFWGLVAKVRGGAPWHSKVVLERAIKVETECRVLLLGYPVLVYHISTFVLEIKRHPFLQIWKTAHPL